MFAARVTRESGGWTSVVYVVCVSRIMHPVWVCVVQVPLMAELPRARAALDAHVGVAGVAEVGLGFLWNLADAEANKVRPHLFEGACG